MIEIVILISFLIVFLFLFEKDKKDRERVDTILKTFENTINNVLDSIEKTNNKFYEMAANIQMAHFEQLQRQSAKQLDSMEKQTESFMEILKAKEPVVSSIDNLPIENKIEKEDEDEKFLDEIPMFPLDGIKVQVEGEEQIHPINIS